MTHLDWLVTIQKIQQDDERHKKNTLKMKINHNKYKEKRKLTGVLGRMCNRLKGWKKRLYIAKKKMVQLILKFTLKFWAHHTRDQKRGNNGSKL